MRLVQHVKASRSAVYRALLDARAVAAWMVPDDDNVPPGIAPADNELGWRISLQKLARLVEAGAMA